MPPHGLFLIKVAIAYYSRYIDARKLLKKTVPSTNFARTIWIYT